MDLWFKISLLVEGEKMVMVFKVTQMIVHETQNQMNHAKGKKCKTFFILLLNINHPLKWLLAF